MIKLNPFIRFNDAKCREAMNFYQECLGGELFFQTVGESPMAKEMPADKKNLIMHSTLDKDGWSLIGSDMMRDKAAVGDNLGISLNFDNEPDIRSVFSKFSQDGEVFMPLEKMFWAELFGVVTDKYGIEWMLNYQGSVTP